MGLNQALSPLLLLGGHRLGVMGGLHPGCCPPAGLKAGGVAAPSRVLFPFNTNTKPPQSRGCLSWALVTARSGCGARGKSQLCCPVWVQIPGAGELWGTVGPRYVLTGGCFMRPRVALCPGAAEIREWDPLTWAAE